MNRKIAALGIVPLAALGIALSACGGSSTSPSTTPQSASYQATSGNTTGGATTVNDGGTSAIGWLGNGSATLTFHVNVPSSGKYTVGINYINGPDQRQALVSANSGPGQLLTFPPAYTVPAFSQVNTLTTQLSLHKGSDTIKFSNQVSWSADISGITIAGNPSS